MKSCRKLWVVARWKAVANYQAEQVSPDDSENAADHGADQPLEADLTQANFKQDDGAPKQQPNPCCWQTLQVPRAEVRSLQAAVIRTNKIRIITRSTRHLPGPVLASAVGFEERRGEIMNVTPATHSRSKDAMGLASSLVIDQNLRSL